MANTYFLISQVVVTGTQSNIEFTNIPDTYTDLLICHSLRTNRNAYHESITLKYNGVTTNQTYRRVYAVNNLNADNSSGVMYGGQANGSTNTPATAFGTSMVYISAYTASRAKIALEIGGSETASTTTLRDQNANIWNSTDPITSITLTPENGGTIQTNSTAYLYGIKNT